MRSARELPLDLPLCGCNVHAAGESHGESKPEFAGKDQRTWDEHWPELLLAVNSAVSESTGYSPCFVTQGREPSTPRALFDENTVDTGAEPGSPTDNATKLKEVFEIVRRNIERAAQDQARHYNLRRRNWSPKVGETV
ncbi:uncharacterized protein [Drosophila bipectinata]|uniref:uncharacterized protein n=1 Tax=Drosophila bipectinata TaxID=42026 RepID=UPI0038B2A6E9